MHVVCISLLSQPDPNAWFTASIFAEEKSAFTSAQVKSFGRQATNSRSKAWAQQSPAKQMAVVQGAADVGRSERDGPKRGPTTLVWLQRGRL